MDRRSLLLALAGGVVATSALGVSAASAAPAALGTGNPVNDLAGVRAALGGEPVEMQRRGGRGGGFRGGGRGFRGGGFRGGGFRRGWGGGGGWRRRGWGGGPGWGWRRRRFWGGPGPGWGPRRRCFVNRWGEFVCRRPRMYW
jgi:hypothetical protein